MRCTAVSRLALAVLASGLTLAVAAVPARAAPATFPAGSLIIPMDQAYQDRGMLQAYGLLFQLLRQGVPVAWVIDPDKTWHAAPCDTPGDLCAWDCAEVGSGVKCRYPTASPDFVASSVVRWDGAGAAPGTALTHAYRGGPFVIDAAYRADAMAVIDVWNDPMQWAAAPWAARATFHVVTVHETTAPFTGNISRPLVAAPSIAVFSDGNEDIATGYLRAAGIKQSNGEEFPANRCGAGTCGPGTLNPDMLTVASVAGDMGTCGAPSSDHKNGALFTDDGLPAYCQIMSMHWNVTDRETVQCGGRDCPATQAACEPSTPITYHGHEVVAEVRSFLAYPVHFFAECQAVNAYENASPDPAWPFLDDAGRDGHFLTTTGTPPPCPCNEPGFTCVTGGCGGADCCLPQDVRERGAGFLIAPRPGTYRVFHPEVPYNQLDGAYAPIGGSEPAYNLSSYLGTMYKNDRQVTFLSGPNGPGIEDLWMTGYLDGTCDIIEPPIPFARGPAPCSGKISYLGGHAFSTSVPMSGSSSSQGARLFLNALFEADCVTTVGQPAVSLGLDGPLAVYAPSLPWEVPYGVRYDNSGAGAALAATLVLQVNDGAAIAAAPDGTIAGDLVSWDVGSVSGMPMRPGDPPAAGSRMSTLRFERLGEHVVALSLAYRVGSSLRNVVVPVTIRVTDQPLAGDGGLDEDGGGGGGDPGGGCCQTGGEPAGPIALGLAVALGVLRRRRR